MGIYIFLTAVIVEISFAVYCIITKANHQKVKFYIRTIELTGFGMLILLTVIKWGLRYYSLAFLLPLLAAMDAAALIRKREDKRTYKSVRIVLKAVGMTVLIFLAALPAMLFPQYEPLGTTGQYKVATSTYTLTDTNRVETYTNTGENRKLNIELWYPEKAEGKYPLIVFSHGSLGIKSSNESLYNELASHGYVVCSIDHMYQCFYTTDKEGKTTFLDMGYNKELMAEDAHSNKQQSYEYYQKWMKIRTGDINFVIDYIFSNTKDNDADKVYKLVDTTKIGVMGHSLGGSAALGIGRLRDDVSAVIALEAPFMYDIEGVKDGEFVYTNKTYPVPVLNVYSDSTWNRLSELPQYAENYALLSSSKATAFNVYIKGVGHLTLTDFALTSPFLTRIINGQKSTTDTEYCLKTLNKISLEFFDAYLKKDGKFTSAGTY